MIRIPFILMAIHFCIAACGSDTIHWCNDRKLTWSDFKFNNPTGYGAATANQILIQLIGPNDSIYAFDVHPIFLCNESWSNDTSKALLAHEQIHFDIAELAARRIRRFLSEKIITEANYLELYNKIRSMIAFQYETNDRFDKETGHGFLNAQQIRWRKLIDSQLKALEKFSSKCPP